MENKKIISCILSIIAISAILGAFWYHRIHYMKAFQMRFLFILFLQIVASTCILKIFQSHKRASIIICLLVIPILFILANIYGTLYSLDIESPYSVPSIIIEVTKCAVFHFLIGIIFAFLQAYSSKRAMLKQ